ncbi:hypothetical protein EGH10_13945 [Brevibacillus laterosporus]|uniref:Uncharacterized protein n=1 Tax=Brevibacillus laterosporus LMG 15441 TaxID=1042163 RepID=A0A075R602_BRELA|nr:hypothetical protein BRLA_c029220 [Brevibacillus laterosporus LMG 15441]RJL11564.1 hypothetical protein DM460_10520 [Brevibacillus laterosporus]TPH09380.1 hypothetical protein EGH10_13945 [Brevibacillus laterosporus]
MSLITITVYVKYKEIQDLENGDTILGYSTQTSNHHVAIQVPYSWVESRMSDGEFGPLFKIKIKK